MKNAPYRENNAIYFSVTNMSVTNTSNNEVLFGNRFFFLQMNMTLTR